jgi:hypothetical protein
MMPDVVGPVRARDLRANIQELGFERGVVKTFEMFLDEYAAHRLREREHIQLTDQLMSQVDLFVRLGQGLRNQVEEIKRVKSQGEQHDGDTQS